MYSFLKPENLKKVLGPSKLVVLSKTTRLTDETDNIPGFRKLRSAYRAHQNADSITKILITISNAILTHGLAAVGLSRRALEKLCKEDANWDDRPGIDKNNYENILWAAYQTIWSLEHREPGRKPTIFVVTQPELLEDLNLTDEKIKEHIAEAKAFVSKGKTQSVQMADHKADQNADTVTQNTATENDGTKHNGTKNPATKNEVTMDQVTKDNDTEKTVPNKRKLEYPKGEFLDSSNDRLLSLGLDVHSEPMKKTEQKDVDSLRSQPLIHGRDFYTPKDDALAILIGKRTDLYDYRQHFIDLAGAGIVFSEHHLAVIKEYARKAVTKKSFHPESVPKQFEAYWKEVIRLHHQEIWDFLCPRERFSLEKAMRTEEKWLDETDDPDLIPHQAEEDEFDEY